MEAYFDILQAVTDGSDAPDDVKSDACDLVLNHCSLLGHFLSRDASHDRRLSRVVTQRVCAIVSAMPAASRALRALRPYVERIESLLCADDVPVDVLRAFLPHMSVEGVGRACEWLARRPPEALLSAGGGLTPSGEAVVAAAGRLGGGVSAATFSCLLRLAGAGAVETLLLSALSARPSHAGDVTAAAFRALMTHRAPCVAAACVAAGATCRQRFAAWCEKHAGALKRDWSKYASVVLQWLTADHEKPTGECPKSGDNI